MAKKQSRKTISFSASLFAAVRERAESLGVPMTSFAEHALQKLMADPTVTATMIHVESRKDGRGSRG